MSRRSIAWGAVREERTPGRPGQEGGGGRQGRLAQTTEPTGIARSPQHSHSGSRIRAGAGRRYTRQTHDDEQLSRFTAPDPALRAVGGPSSAMDPARRKGHVGPIKAGLGRWHRLVEVCTRMVAAAVSCHAAFGASPPNRPPSMHADPQCRRARGSNVFAGLPCPLRAGGRWPMILWQAAGSPFRNQRPPCKAEQQRTLRHR